MSKRRFRPPPKRRIIIDHGRLEDIPRSRAFHQQVLKYRWDLYSNLAFQRAQIYDDLKASVREKASHSFSVYRWQRAVKYQYGLDPLSARGSVINEGGRFSVGAIDPSRFAIFPALYLAADKDTALDEMFGRADKQELLSYEELALTRADSVAVVSISGVLESILDLRSPESLSKFVTLTKDFSMPKALLEEAKRLNRGTTYITNTVSELLVSILEPRWRHYAMQWDIPSNSQILGQIVADAGIEGIVYPSTRTGHPCLAVYPQNFANSSSYLQIDDPLPDPGVKSRIDKDTFEDFM